MADSSRCLRLKFFRAPEIFEMGKVGYRTGMEEIKGLTRQFTYKEKSDNPFFSPDHPLSPIREILGIHIFQLG